MNTQTTDNTFSSNQKNTLTSKEGKRNVFRNFQWILGHKSNQQTQHSQSSSSLSSNSILPSNVGNGALIGNEIDLEGEERKRILSECLKKMSKEEPLFTRLSFIKEFDEFLRIEQFEETSLLWNCVEDLLRPIYPLDIQLLVFTLVSSLVHFQYSHLSPSLRLSIFRWIQSPSSFSSPSSPPVSNSAEGLTHYPTPFLWRLKLLKQLTKDGRDIQPFEMELGKLILEWLNESSQLNHGNGNEEGTNVEQELVLFNTLLIKFNFGLLEEKTVCSMLNHVCFICNNATTIALMEHCLRYFDIMVRYGHIYPSCLTLFISSLCRTVNVERFCKFSWHILTNVLKSNYGYQGIQSLSSILLDPNNQSTINLLRGAVFFLGMSVWGSQRITSLSVSPSSVLSPLLYVLSSNQNIIYYEVLLTVNRLLKKYGQELKVEWDILITIISKLQGALDMQENTNFATVFGEVVSTLGDLCKKQLFFGDRKQLFALLENSPQYQQESFVVSMIEEKMKECSPMNDQWTKNLNSLMSCYFSNEHRSGVKLKVITELRALYFTFRHFYEEEMIEHIVLQILSQKSCYYPESIREETIEFLLGILKESCSPQCVKILEIVERSLLMTKGEEATRRKIIVGLLEVFKNQFQGELHSFIINLFIKLIKYLREENNASIRREIISQLVYLRANSKYQVLFGEKLNSSISCISKGIQPSSKLKSFRNSIDLTLKSTSVLPIDELVQSILHSMMQRDLSKEFFSLSVNGIASMLRNRFIVAQVDINNLTLSLCRILKIKLGEEHKDQQYKEETGMLLIQTITLLIGYHLQMTVDGKQEMVSSFIFAMNLKWNSLESKQKVQRICLHSLSICLIELPSLFIVHHVGKFIQQSETSTFGLQVLEFLMLLSNTKVASSLSSQDFEKVFSIVVSYIDPKKNSPHIAASAYSVLGAWFLCSPKPQRIHYFRLISKNLYPMIQDGSSLLAEAAIDFMARYSYHDYSAYEKDPPSFLFEESQSKSWTTGNSIITIKTGQFGYSRITIRRSTGSIQYTVHLPPSFSLHKNTNQLVLPESLEHFQSHTSDSDSITDYIAHESSPLSVEEKKSSPIFAPLRKTLSLNNDGFEEKQHLIPKRDHSTDAIPSSKDLPQKSPNSVSLFAFYPPLPSYEAEKEDVASPCLFTSDVEPSLFLPSTLLDLENKKLNTEGQLMLHCPEKLVENGQFEALMHFNVTNATTPPQIAEHVPPLLEMKEPNLTVRQSASEEQIDIREENFTNLTRPTSPSLGSNNEESYLIPFYPKLDSISAVQDPNFVFSQMQQIPFLHPKTKGLKEGDALDRAITVLDRTMNVETHKIGILYVGPGQSTEEEILRNRNGTPRYHKFIQSIGQIVRLQDCRESGIYTGGLDAGGDEDEDGGSKRNSTDSESPLYGDGEYSILWKNDIQQIMFHVATLMPNRKNDKAFTNKKRHIGNDNVTIIYSDSETSYQPETIVGQFNFVAIIIYPLDEGYYRLEIKKKSVVPDFGPISFSFGASQIVTESALATIVRQLALNGDLAALLYQKNMEFRSNVEVRLSQIRQISSRLSKDSETDISFPNLFPESPSQPPTTNLSPSSPSVSRQNQS